MHICAAAVTGKRPDMIGQLLFIAGVFATFALARQIARRISVQQPAWAWAVPPYAIGSLAIFWVIQRIATF